MTWSQPAPEFGRQIGARDLGEVLNGLRRGDEEVRLETGPGDYVFVPPYVPHREENPGDEPAVVIIARSSQQGIVVNLPSLWPDQDRS